MCAFTTAKQTTSFNPSEKAFSKHYLLTEVSIFSPQQLNFPFKAQNQFFFGVLKIHIQKELDRGQTASRGIKMMS